MSELSLMDVLKRRFATAIAEISGQPEADVDPQIRPATDARFGDYQCNAAMALAKSLRSKPQELAKRIVASSRLEDVADPPQVAGPGFINVRLSDAYLQRRLAEIPRPPAESGATTNVDRVGIPPSGHSRRVVIDYSSPNIAKEMHVGHLRSTIIGDVFARTLAFLGHDVKRQNHVGDWGTQMGMVILGIWHLFMFSRRGVTIAQIDALSDELAAARQADPARRDALLSQIASQQQADLDSDPAGVLFDAWLDDFAAGRLPLKFDLATLTPTYRFVNAVESAAEGRPVFVVDRNHGGKQIPLSAVSNWITAAMLQAGELQEQRAWRLAIDASLEECQRTYQRLGVLLRREDACGESFYHERLAATVQDLRAKFPPRDKSRPADGAYIEMRDDQGAACLFFYDANHAPVYKRADDQELPMIIQKSDGAFLYATTDLAAIRYRIQELGGQRLVYVTDARQKLHFEMLFKVARAIGWAGTEISLEHTTFGSVLGEDRKPLKTRAGQSIKLSELLEEAQRRAYELIVQRDESAEPEAQGDATAEHVQTSEGEKREIARQVGIAAVKYADLARDRNSDYLFSWDKMLALQGNTAPYMMYAYARIRSIYRKAAARFGEPDVYRAEVAIPVAHPAERALALRLARFHETIDELATALEPHTLCTHLFDLAADFMRFYEACPVVQAPDEPTRLGRMRLCDLAARTLKLGLGLLGIEVIERM